MSQDVIKSKKREPRGWGQQAGPSVRSSLGAGAGGEVGGELPSLQAEAAGEPRAPFCAGGH